MSIDVDIGNLDPIRAADTERRRGGRDSGTTRVAATAVESPPVNAQTSQEVGFEAAIL